MRRAAPRGLPADPGHGAHVRWPEGPGLRTDRAVESGSDVGAAYDSLVAKVMAHGADRTAAVARWRALRALELDGLETNRDLLAAVLDDDAYRRGEADIHYLDGRPDLRDAALPDEVAAAARRGRGLRPAARRAGRSLVPVPSAGWRNVGRRCTRTSCRRRGTIEVRGPPGRASLS